MRRFYKVRLGHKHKYADVCFKESCVGVDFNLPLDFTGKFHENWRDFNKEYRPVYLEYNPGKSKIAAGLACGAIHTVGMGMAKDDIVISPDGSGAYYIGEINGNYRYKEDDYLPHRRPVDWYDQTFNAADVSNELLTSLNSRGTYCELEGHEKEILHLITRIKSGTINVESAETNNFSLETYLEHFLIENWAQTPLSDKYDIYEEEGELVGQQFQTDTGPMDILAVSKDNKTLLVIELKKGRASDRVVGQVQRYMGFVKEELAEENQKVKGIIIALEDNLRIRRALSIAKDISFYRYEVDFKLFKV